MTPATGARTRPAAPPDLELAALAETAGALTTGPVELVGPGTTRVHGLCLATSRIVPGDLYAALPGTRAHGADHAAAAVAAGAVAVLTDPEGARRLAAGPAADVPRLVVPDVRALLGALAADLYQHPTRSMTTLAVTGTQGKTTTTRLLEQALELAEVPAAVIGTVGTRVLGEEVETSLTTPEAPDLQALFARMVEQHVAVCAMEVSSHALVLGRVDGVVFDVAVFLNLGRDHLDFHTDVEDYYRAKAALFTPNRSRRAVVNLDDEHGRRLAGELAAAGQPVRTFSLTDTAGADYRAEEIVSDATGSDFVLVGPDVRVATRVALPGRFNVANALAGLAAAAQAGLDVTALARALPGVPGVPGRLEPVDAGQPFAVVVDYAHKPDAVEAALTTLRPLTTGRVLVVLGAGGDRDPGKRPLMGESAARLADVVVVTDDNPRTEDPALIRAAVLAGARAASRPGAPAEVLEIGDRRAAIRYAVAAARPGDIVLVAGKGHETGQEVHGQVHPFDDRVVAREEVVAR